MAANVVCASCGRSVGQAHQPTDTPTYGLCPSCLRQQLHTVASLAKTTLLLLTEIERYFHEATGDQCLGVYP